VRIEWSNSWPTSCCSSIADSWARVFCAKMMLLENGISDWFWWDAREFVLDGRGKFPDAGPVERVRRGVRRGI